MKLRITIINLFLLLATVGLSQVPKKIVVEHFTNSQCPPCATRNPGFYSNMNTNNTGNIIHVAYHPSSPFATCVFSAHNSTGNDARTIYYGVYGSTPRLVINGDVISAGVSYSQSSLFTNYLNQTSPVQITINEQNVGFDSIEINVNVMTVMPNNLGQQSLEVILAEDTVFYMSPNGEGQHYDVYRKTLSSISGMVNIPQSPGGSFSLSETVAIDAAWDVTRIFSTAILQDPMTKDVTQAEASTPSLMVIAAPTPGVAKNILFEHFTNTDCSSCAIENGAFYTNYSSSMPMGGHHVSYHMEMMGSSCDLHQGNPVENNARARFNGVLGNDMRMVINGDALPANSNYGSPNLWSAYTNQETPLSISVTQSQIGYDSIAVDVVVKTVGSAAIGAQKLQILLAEDTVFFNAPNGEMEHYNVFRKLMLDTLGMNVVPAMLGDSLVYSFKVETAMDWDLSRIFPIAFLQDENTGEVSQSATAIPNLMARPQTGNEVPRKIIVEHFTNTRCSVCASRNPGLYNNIDNQNDTNILHLAIHPSSPYSSCILNQHDVDGNDDRTKYYGSYGSTPKIVINGENRNGSFADPMLFDDFRNQTSPFSLHVTQQKVTDSMRVRIVIRAETDNSLPAQNFYVALAEDTVFYNAPNGEDEHYDVFRTAVYGNTGTVISLPTVEGDSLVFIKTVANSSDWDMDRMFAIALLQNEGDKKVTQVEATDPSDHSDIISSINSNIENSLVQVYPNPANNQVILSNSLEGVSDYQIQDLTGKNVFTGSFNSKTTVNINSLPSGLYIVTISNGSNKHTHKLIKVTP